MRDDQRRALRAKLEEERDRLLGTGPKRLDPNRTDASGGYDEDHQSLNEMHQAIASNRNRDRDSRLAAIEDALELIADDPEEYGICEECDGEIPVRRLELMPWTTICVPCKEAQEAGPAGTLKRATRKKLTDHV